jgi:hypothetical protein
MQLFLYSSVAKILKTPEIIRWAKYKLAYVKMQKTYVPVRVCTLFVHNLTLTFPAFVTFFVHVMFINTWNQSARIERLCAVLSFISAAADSIWVLVLGLAFIVVKKGGKTRAPPRSSGQTAPQPTANVTYRQAGSTERSAVSERINEEDYGDVGDDEDDGDGADE